MVERPANFLVKHAAGIAQPVAKQIESTVKTVAKEARRGGHLGPKAASTAAKTLGAGGKAAVTGGVTALKEVGGQVLGKGGQNGKGGSGGKTKVTNIIEEIDIGAPRQLVYDQWTRFGEFPNFTKKVRSAEQVADEKVRWKAKIFWSTRTWESTIVEQVPDERIVWRSTGQKGYVDGAVTFHELASDLTRVLLVLEYHPHGFMEKTGNLWRAQGRRARLELKHFRRHMMSQVLLHSDRDVDGWRGEIHDGEVATTHEDAVSADERTGDGRKSDGKAGRSRTRSAGSSGAAKSSGAKSTATRSSEEKSAATKSSGNRRSSGTDRSSDAKKSSASGRSSGGRGGSDGGSSSSGTRRSTAKQTAGAQEK